MGCLEIGLMPAKQKQLFLSLFPPLFFKTFYFILEYSRLVML